MSLHTAYGGIAITSSMPSKLLRLTAWPDGNAETPESAAELPKQDLHAHLRHSLLLLPAPQHLQRMLQPSHLHATPYCCPIEGRSGFCILWLPAPAPCPETKQRLFRATGNAYSIHQEAAAASDTAFRHFLL